MPDTRNLTITKEHPGLIDSGWCYMIVGRLEAEGSIRVELGKWLWVTGCIEAGGGIKAGRGIAAGEGIKAGGSILCKLTLRATHSIFAGVCTWREPEASDLLVECRWLAGGTVAHGTLKEVEPAKKKPEAVRERRHLR